MSFSTYYEIIPTDVYYACLNGTFNADEDSNDDYFEKLYSKYLIERVPAKRVISCNGERRGEINELIIRNFSK